MFRKNVNFLKAGELLIILRKIYAGVAIPVYAISEQAPEDFPCLLIRYTQARVSITIRCKNYIVGYATRTTPEEPKAIE